MASMARPRTFDEETVVSDLTRQFWSCGYEGSAMPDLERATGLTRKSLYNAFGDKHDMFVRAIKHFSHVSVRQNTVPLRSTDASLAEIEALLDGLVVLSGTPEGRRGCMICNTAREPIASDPDVKAQIDAYFKSLEAALRRAIVRGQRAGEIVGRPAKDLARLCLGAVISISVLAKAGQPVAVLRSIADETIRALR